jgi:hypothetical protein
VPQSKSGNSIPLAKGRKEVISTTITTLQGVIYTVYPPLRNTAGAPGEKNSKLQRNKGLKP